MTPTDATPKDALAPEAAQPAETAAPVFQKVDFDAATTQAGPIDPEAAEAALKEAGMYEPEETSVYGAMSLYSAVPDLDSSDIVWPRLRLAQGLSPEVQQGIAKPGQWVLVGQEPADQLTIVPMMFAKRRELVDKDFNKLCTSRDSRTGVGDPGGDCSRCIMAQFTGPKAQRVPPQCSLVYTYLVYIVEYGTVAQMDLKKTSSPVGKLLNTIIMQKGMGNFAIVLGQKSQQSRYGTFNVPTVRPTAMTPEIKAAAASAMSAGGF